MNTIVKVLLGLSLAFQLTAQSYSSSEFIVRYTSSASPINQQVLRDLYGISEYSTINSDNRLELWANINFPITYTENGESSIINNVEELLWHINIQNGEQGNSTARSNVQDGDLQMLLFIGDGGLLYSNGTFDPLPNCDDSHNNRLIGQDQSVNSNQERIKVIIADQYIPGMTTINLFNDSTVLGGTHGLKVFSVIENILTQTGATGVEYLNLVTFENTGQSTSDILLKLAGYLEDQFESGDWGPEDRVIVNFSANLITTTGHLAGGSSTLKQEWAEIFGTTAGSSPIIPFDNITLVSAAGNQGFDSRRNVFPGEIALATEISVAGTEQCFTQPWQGTNSNPEFYEIATEAVDILTNDGSNYYLSTGTSFAAPQVTAALAQLAIANPNSSMVEIKSLLLSNADIVPALNTTVENGQVLNLSNYFSQSEADGGTRRIETDPTLTHLTLQTSPNPFSQVSMVTMEVPVGVSAQVSLYNSVGQLVAEEHIPNQQELTELQWYTPANLPAGTYFLQVQAGKDIQQQMIIKQ